VLAILPPVWVANASAARAATFTPLTLRNGWTNAPFGTRNAAAKTINGIVSPAGSWGSQLRQL